MLVCGASLLLGLLLRAGAGQPATVPLGDLGQIQVCATNIIRITRWPNHATKSRGRQSLIARQTWPEVWHQVTETDEDVTVTTKELTLTFSKTSGTGSFADASSGKVILSEAAHSFKAVTDLGHASYEIRQSWSGPAEEGLYGGGSFQNGLINYKHAPISLIQFNLEAVVPFFASSAGYGLLWDNYAWTYLNPPTPETALAKPSTAKAQSGEVMFQPTTSGDHFFHMGRLMDDSSKPMWGGGHETFVTVQAEEGGSEIVAIQWTKDEQNHPSSLTGRVENMKAGRRYRVRFSFDTPGAGLYVQGPEHDSGRTTLRSSLAEAIDYYFVKGPRMDDVIAGYRSITGVAPLYGKYAFGFWQCREHYASQAELLEAAHGFRDRSIPVDAIVQDWLYWGDLGWGPEWDLTRYPDPAGMVKVLKTLDMKLMVSVWGKFDNKTAIFKAMKTAGMVLGNTNQTNNNWYDAWNPNAQTLYYEFCNKAHFAIGVESLWLDATEPEGLPNIDQETFLGSGNQLMNTFSLETTSGIANGLRKDYPTAQGARVFSLTRSSFAGQQKTGAALWTGDTTASWDMLRRQVASSINYPMSGIPYWAQDIGGFFRPKDQYTSDDYRRLMIRWFQFGVFTPIFRVHGAGTHTEIWNFGNTTMDIVNTSAITLRYRLLPYVYSGFWRVEAEAYTMQRALAFDFPEEASLGIADAYMFGPSLLVTPIVSAGDSGKATTRQIYFPQGSWINFHTGEAYGGMQDVSFTLQQAPFFCQKGSLLVLGPSIQSTSDPNPDLEVRIYPGADSTFELFEDDGSSTKYREGSYSTIVFAWQDSTQTLRISSRKGAYPGMPQARRICTVVVSPGHGVGVFQGTCDRQVTYAGEEIAIEFQSLVVV